MLQEQGRADENKERLDKRQGPWQRAWCGFSEQEESLAVSKQGTDLIPISKLTFRLLSGSLEGGKSRNKNTHEAGAYIDQAKGHRD